MYIQSNSISFNGWEPNRMLKDSGKINNAECLDALANASNADCIRTNMVESEFLPSNYLYTNIASKHIKGKNTGSKFIYGVNCVILPKNASSEVVSEKLYESAQVAVGKLYAELAKYNLSSQVSSEVNKQESSNIFKRIFSKLINLKK